MASPADDGVRVLEIQGRALPPRLTVALAAVAAVAAAAVIVAAQPLRSPWWTYADADATYVAGGLNLLVGERTTYLDHPGLPLQELLEVSFGVGWLVSGDSRDEYARDVLLDLDDVRALFRGLAVVFYLAGAAVFTLVCARIAGGPLWGLAGGLLWLGAPGLAAMSIQYRPDVMLATLCLVSAWLVVRAAQAPTPDRYALAGLAVGLAMTVKIHAAGLLVPLALAAAWRRVGGSVPRSPARAWPAVAAWALAIVVMNANNVPFRPTLEQAVAGIGLLALLAYGLSRLPFAPVVGGLALGIAIPVSLDLGDGLQALVVMARGVTGGGVNTGVEPFAGTLDDAWNRVPHVAFFVFALAAVAAVIGLVRREPAPVLLFAGAATLAAMGLARFADTHYFAPAFALAVPGALLLFRSLPVGGVAAALTLALVVAGQALAHRDDPARDRAAFRERAEPELRAALARAREDEVVLTPSYWPTAGTRFFEVVEPYTELARGYPYRTLPEGAAAFARERGLRICCAVGGARMP